MVSKNPTSFQVEGRSQTASVRLHPSEEIVSVRLKELGEVEDKPLYDSKSEDKKKEKKSREREATEAQALLSNRLKEQQLEDREANGNGASERPWLAPHIRVKIIDKRKSHGK